ncbi:MAG: flagellar biosynthetic protein FliR [Pseudomonadales bacterium]
MLEVDSSIIGGWIGSMMWPFFRIGAFLLSAPIVGTQLVPQRVRIVLAFVLTVILVPHLPPMPVVDAVSIPAFILVAQQLLIGVGLGLILQVLFQLFVVAGQMMAMQMGLGFASMVDPTNGVTVTVLSQFHLMLVTLLFLAMNGHLAMIEVLAESFYALPVGGGFFTSNALWSLVGWGSWMFTSALLMAIPAMACMLIINFSMGVVTRAAPQLNIFAIGFPFMLIVGLGIVWVLTSGYLPIFDRYTRQALDMMAFMVKG